MPLMFKDLILILYYIITSSKIEDAAEIQHHIYTSYNVWDDFFSSTNDTFHTKKKKLKIPNEFFRLAYDDWVENQQTEK